MAADAAATTEIPVSAVGYAIVITTGLYQYLTATRFIWPRRHPAVIAEIITTMKCPRQFYLPATAAINS